MRERCTILRSLIVVILLFVPATTVAQRCGDSILLYLRDRRGKIIAPYDFDSARVSVTYTAENVSPLVDTVLVIKEAPTMARSFLVRVECGIKIAEFRFTYKGDKMVIRVLNVPGDARNILLDGVPFRKGVYEVDLGTRPMKNVERYEGNASMSENLTEEIGWVVRGKSLKKSR